MPDIFTLSRRGALAGLAAALVPLPALSQGTPGGNGETPPITLRAAPSRRKLLPDAAEEAELWLFDGPSPVPVLRTRHGEEFAARLINDTPAPLALHWQGLRGPNRMDGVAGLTQSAVAPGASFDYRFKPADPGLVLIRPLVPGRSSEAAGFLEP